MSAEVISFAEAASRIRAHRRSGVVPADVLWIAAICCWPISLVVFMTQAVVGASPNRSGGRP